jgi:hypothetical protein
MFSSGGRTITIQVIREDPFSSSAQPFEGQAVNQNTIELVQIIQ